ncbi:MAG: CHAP domain-containing protein [Patescibacteria group bacterium]
MINQMIGSMSCLLMLMMSTGVKATCDDGAHAYMDEFDGVVAYSNGGYTGTGYGDCQCVEYIKRFYGTGSVGNGNVACTNLASLYGFNYYSNGGTTQPRVGDVLCFSYGAYGHVAIIDEVNSSSVEIIDQNRSSSDATLDLSLAVSGGRYTIGNFGSSAVYVATGWARDPSYTPPSTCTDHTYDVIAVEASADGSSYDWVSFFLRDDDTLQSYGTVASNVGNTSGNVALLVGNIDSNSYDEIVEVRTSGSRTYLYVYQPTGDGGFGSRTLWRTETGFAAEEAFLADTNNDGKADVILGNEQADSESDHDMQWYKYTSTGSSFSSCSNWTTDNSDDSFGQNGDVFAIGDFNYNGKAEILRGRDDYSGCPSNLAWYWLQADGDIYSPHTCWGYMDNQFLVGNVDTDSHDEIAEVRSAHGYSGSTVPTYSCDLNSSTGALTSTKRANDSGGTSGWYYMYDVNEDGYDDLIRWNAMTVTDAGDVVWLCNNTGGNCYHSVTRTFMEQTYEQTMVTGISQGSGDYLLWGYFGQHTVCE